MEKSGNAFKIIVNSVKDIVTFWPSVFSRAIMVATISIVTVGGIDTMIGTIAYLIEKYILGKDVEFGDFVRDSYIMVFCALFVLFSLYMILHEAAKKYKHVKEIADKITWEGLKITGFNPPEDSFMGIGLRIESNIPFETIFGRPELTKLRKGLEILPLFGDTKIKLPWYSEGGGLTLGNRRLDKNLPQTVAIGKWNEDKNKATLFTSGQVDDEIEFEANKQYRVVVQLQGEKGECILPLREITATILLEDKKLKIKKTGDNVIKARLKERIEQKRE